MRTNKTTLLSLPLLLSFSFSGLAQTGSLENGVETVATVQTESGTEDICEGPDGTLYVTILQDRIIWRIPPGGQVEQFAALPEKVAIVGCAAHGEGLIVAALSKPFLRPGADGEGPSMDFSDVGPEVLVLDGTGETVSTVPGRPGELFTAVTALGAYYLVADAAGGTIWRFDPQTERLDLWLEDDRLAPAVDGPPIGMEGIAARDGFVVAGNNSKQALYRIDVGPDGLPQGGPVQLMQGEFAPNDFDVDPDGVTYAPRDGSVFRVTASGQVSTLAENVPNGGAAAVSSDGRWLYWPTLGGAGPQPGTERVLRVPLE